MTILALEQAALVAALEIMKELAVAAAERQFASNALHDLVTNSSIRAGDLLARASTFGWDLRRPVTVLVAHEDGGGASGEEPTESQSAGAARDTGLWNATVRSRDPQAASAGFATELVAIIGNTDPLSIARLVQADFRAGTRRGYSIDVSRVSASPPDIPKLYQEARTAASVGRRLHGGGAVTSFAGLGLHALFSGMPKSELRSFLNDTLGPVLMLPVDQTR